MQKGSGMYAFSIFLSTLSFIMPGIVIVYSLYSSEGITINKIALWIICIIITIFLSRPLTLMRNHFREMSEYDEFGRSIKKGIYENLSRAERDAIDLQKTAEMERILDTSVIKKLTKKGSLDPAKDMQNLIGLIPVKKKMQEMVARMEFEAEEKKRKKKAGAISSGRHMVFYGSPGTGKTTVARIITGFLFKYGYIKKNKVIEVDGNFLKMGAQGESALKTELLIREAYDGVLFIDEAYALYDGIPGGNGEEVISTLIKRMEDSRDRFILILAGYTDPMKVLLETNPGFASRIKEYLIFPDYNTIEMRQIFMLMANQRNFTVDVDAFDNFDERIRKERALASFGNGRTVRNILDEAIDKHALNLNLKLLPQEKRYVICGIDISMQIKR